MNIKQICEEVNVRLCVFLMVLMGFGISVPYVADRYFPHLDGPANDRAIVETAKHTAPADVRPVVLKSAVGKMDIGRRLYEPSGRYAGEIKAIDAEGQRVLLVFSGGAAEWKTRETILKSFKIAE